MSRGIHFRLAGFAVPALTIFVAMVMNSFHALPQALRGQAALNAQCNVTFNAWQQTQPGPIEPLGRDPAGVREYDPSVYDQAPGAYSASFPLPPEYQGEEPSGIFNRVYFVKDSVLNGYDSPLTPEVDYKLMCQSWDTVTEDHVRHASVMHFSTEFFVPANVIDRPGFQMVLSVDIVLNGAKVFLNGQPINPASSSNNSNISDGESVGFYLTKQNGLQAGKNDVRIALMNRCTESMGLTAYFSQMNCGQDSAVIIGECDPAMVCCDPITSNFRAQGAQCPDDNNTCTIDQCSGTSATCSHPAKAVGTDCQIPTGGDNIFFITGVCKAGAVCSACGNGVVEEGFFEECDDANTVDDDGCNNNCKASGAFYCVRDPYGENDCTDGKLCIQKTTECDECESNADCGGEYPTCVEETLEFAPDAGDFGTCQNNSGDARQGCGVSVEVCTKYAYPPDYEGATVLGDLDGYENEYQCSVACYPDDGLIAGGGGGIDGGDGGFTGGGGATGGTTGGTGGTNGTIGGLGGGGGGAGSNGSHSSDGPQLTGGQAGPGAGAGGGSSASSNGNGQNGSVFGAGGSGGSGGSSQSGGISGNSSRESSGASNGQRNGSVPSSTSSVGSGTKSAPSSGVSSVAASSSSRILPASSSRSAVISSVSSVSSARSGSLSSLGSSLSSSFRSSLASATSSAGSLSSRGVSLASSAASSVRTSSASPTLIISSENSSSRLSSVGTSRSASSSVSILVLDINPTLPPPSVPTPFPISYVPLAPGTMPFDPVTRLPLSVPQPSPLCGNGQLTQDEECDDGNRNDLDGCSSYCLLERGACGDGRVQLLLGEQCEPGLPSDFSCLSNCRYALPNCGDAVVNPGESCDAGLQNGNTPISVCRPDCSLARCGDLVLDFTEECEDGNRLPGDGCDAFCRTERGGAPGAPGTLPASVFEIPQTGGKPGAPQYGIPGSTNVGDVPVTTKSGPEALAIMAAGMAAGYAWMRRRK